MRLSVQTRLPPVNEVSEILFSNNFVFSTIALLKHLFPTQVFSALTVGAPIPSTQNTLNQGDASSFYSIPRKKGYVQHVF